MLSLLAMTNTTSACPSVAIRLPHCVHQSAAMKATILRSPAPCTARARPQPLARRAAAAPVRAAANKADTYVPPSSRTAATELTALERFSEVVPDVLLSASLQAVEAPKAATASRSVLAGIIGSGTAPARYKVRRAGRLRLIGAARGCAIPPRAAQLLPLQSPAGPAVQAGARHPCGVLSAR